MPKTNLPMSELLITSFFDNECAILDKWCHGILDAHLVLTFQIFAREDGIICVYVIFNPFRKPEIKVKKFYLKSRLVGGENFMQELPKFLQTFLDIQTYFYIRALWSRSLRDRSRSHKSRFATFVCSCSALRASTTT